MSQLEFSLKDNNGILIDLPDSDAHKITYCSHDEALKILRSRQQAIRLDADQAIADIEAIISTGWTSIN